MFFLLDVLFIYWRNQEESFCGTDNLFRKTTQQQSASSFSHFQFSTSTFFFLFVHYEDFISHVMFHKMSMLFCIVFFGCYVCMYISAFTDYCVRFTVQQITSLQILLWQVLVNRLVRCIDIMFSFSFVHNFVLFYLFHR